MFSLNLYPTSVYFPGLIGSVLANNSFYLINNVGSNFFQSNLSLIILNPNFFPMSHLLISSIDSHSYSYPTCYLVVSVHLLISKMTYEWLILSTAASLVPSRTISGSSAQNWKLPFYSYWSLYFLSNSVVK